MTLRKVSERKVMRNQLSSDFVLTFLRRSTLIKGIVMQHSVIYNIYNIYDFYYQSLQSQIKKKLLNSIQSVLHCVL